MSENIEKLVDAIGSGDMIGSGDAFKAALDAKIAAALDQERIAVADSIFNDSGDETIVDDELGEFDESEVIDELSSEDEPTEE